MSVARRAFYFSTRAAGLWSTVRRTLVRGHVAILTYHGIVRDPLRIPDSCFLDQASFADQVATLVEHFDVIPLREVTARLRDARVDRPTVAITFDDGYRNNYDVAFPVLRRMGVPATIFLATDLIDSDEMIWSCRLHRALTDTAAPALTWGGTRFELDTLTARHRAASSLKRSLKALPQAALTHEVAAIVRDLGDDPGRPAESDSPFRMLDTAAVREMADSGLIEFGAHTCSHAILSKLTDAECEREIADSVHRVSRLAARPCVLFAYPNGQACDYTGRAVSALASSGVQTAVTTMKHANVASTPPLELGRFPVRAGMTGADVVSMLDGAYVNASVA